MRTTECAHFCYTLEAMIQKSHRFHGYGSLNGVYRRGETVREPNLTLKFLRRPSDKPSRVAVVVSKKVSKSAVVRNRIRRRIYEIVRLQEAVNSGFDLVFTAFSPELASQEQRQLTKTVTSLLQKATKSDPTTPGSQGSSRAIVKSEGK